MVHCGVSTWQRWAQQRNISLVFQWKWIYLHTILHAFKKLWKSEKEQSGLDPILPNHLIRILSDYCYVKLQDPTPSEYATIAAAIVKHHPFFADSLSGAQCYVSCFSILSNYIAHTIHSFQHLSWQSPHILQDSVKKQLSQRFRNLRRASHQPQVQNTAVCIWLLVQELSVILKLYYIWYHCIWRVLCWIICTSKVRVFVCVTTECLPNVGSCPRQDGSLHTYINQSYHLVWCWDTCNKGPM